MSHGHLWKLTRFRISPRYFSTNFKLHYLSNRYFKSKATPLQHHYVTLNIDTDASIDDIKKSYKNLIKKWHPDIHSSKSLPKQKEAHKQFLLIREAYEIIINHKQNANNFQTKGNPDFNIHQAHGEQHEYGFTAGRRTPKGPKQTYYDDTWNRKVYERYPNEFEFNDDNSYSSHQYDEPMDTYGDTQPTLIRCLLVTAVCFGIIKYFYASDIGYTSSTIYTSNDPKQSTLSTVPNRMPHTAKLVALQPHIDGHRLWEPENENNKNGNKKLGHGEFEVIVVDRNGQKRKKIINRKDLRPKSAQYMEARDTQKSNKKKQQQSMHTLQR